MDVQDLFPEIESRVPGASSYTMQDALVRAARQLCTQTWWLRRKVALTLNTTDLQYPITCPDGELPLGIKYAGISGVVPAIGIATSAVFDPTLAVGPPRRISYAPPGLVNLDRNADQAYTLDLTVPVQPAADAVTIADELGQSFRAALGHGALAWLFLHKPWADANLAKLELEQFSAYISNAKGEAMRDFQSGSVMAQGGLFVMRGR